MKVTLVLRNDHEMLQNLLTSFRKVRARDKNSRRGLLDQNRQPVHFHSKRDLEIFHPPGTSAAPEHPDIADLLGELNEICTSDESLELKIDNVGHENSADEDEEETSREARQSLSRQRRENSASSLTDTRMSLPTPPYKSISTHLSLAQGPQGCCAVIPDSSLISTRR